MRLATLFLVLLVSLVLVELSNARGRRGSRGGSRTKSSRTCRTRSRSSSNPKITKYTPITATSVCSPVIRNQTKLGLRSDTLKKTVASYSLYRYVLSHAPVYRHGYPMYRSYVSIPEDRAVRVSYKEEKLLNNERKLCLEQVNENLLLGEGIDDNLVELNTTVKYENGTIVKLHGVNNTVALLGDIKEQVFTVRSRARYNTSILPGTDCTEVETAVEGTMVVMYLTNPSAMTSQPSMTTVTAADQTRPFLSAGADHGVFLPAVIALLALINVLAYQF